MRVTFAVAAALLFATGCSDQSAPDTVEADEQASEGATADRESAEPDYDIPEDTPDLFWFVSSGEGYSSALYGPQDAGGILLLSCAGDEVEVTLQEVDGPDGRETATVQSGPLTGKFKTTFEEEGMALLSFRIPANDPIVRRFARDGLFISFPNGEKNSFPPSGKISLGLAECIG